MWASPLNRTRILAQTGELDLRFSHDYLRSAWSHLMDRRARPEACASPWRPRLRRRRVRRLRPAA